MDGFTFAIVILEMFQSEKWLDFTECTENSRFKANCDGSVFWTRVHYAWRKTGTHYSHTQCVVIRDFYFVLSETITTGWSMWTGR